MLNSMHRPSGIAWLVAPGLAMIAVTYGLARFAYGLFLPEMRESLDLSDSVLGLIGAGSYAGYCLAVLGALVLTSRSGPRLMALAAGSVAVQKTVEPVSERSPKRTTRSLENVQ